jgi:Zn-dependent M28 family amino/carboxypeptidase
VTYHVGPGPAQLHMKLSFEWKNRPLYNVMVTIPGTTRADEWVIFGNHHDAWVMGADDPISGASSLMETARGLGELLKTGWRPSRTIKIALWDGEEWGLLGSTEWAEKHDADFIVMGSHGHTAFYDLLVGSTTHGVLMRSKCPVVIVPAVKEGSRLRKKTKRAAAV